jgi:acetyltransferase-like isoleucine patch superfamily enzyme
LPSRNSVPASEVILDALARAVQEGWEGVRTRWQLRVCTAVGKRVELRGTPLLANRGELVIGDDFVMRSIPIRSHIAVARGRCRIGNRVRIGAGAAVACLHRVDIEDDVTIGDFVMIMDSDFHQAGDRAAAAKPKPIRVGAGARIGHRTVILPGSPIGAGAWVKSGSVVSGEVAPGSVVSGNPARPHPAQQSLDESHRALDVPTVVKNVFGLRSLPGPDAGPDQIKQWDSLGALRLLVALEEAFHLDIEGDQFKAVRSVGDLIAYVELARQRSASSVAARA